MMLESNLLKLFLKSTWKKFQIYFNIPPKDTNRSVQPNKTSRLYRMMGHVKNSILMLKSSRFFDSGMLLPKMSKGIESILIFTL